MASLRRDVYLGAAAFHLGASTACRRALADLARFCCWVQTISVPCSHHFVVYPRVGQHVELLVKAIHIVEDGRVVTKPSECLFTDACINPSDSIGNVLAIVGVANALLGMSPPVEFVACIGFYPPQLGPHRSIRDQFVCSVVDDGLGFLIHLVLTQLTLTNTKGAYNQD